MFLLHAFLYVLYYYDISKIYTIFTTLFRLFND